MLSFYPLDVLDEILNLIESVSEGFLSTLVCTISLKAIDGISPNLHGYIIGTSLRVDLILVTLTSFSRSQEGLNM